MLLTAVAPNAVPFLREGRQYEASSPVGDQLYALLGAPDRRVPLDAMLDLLITAGQPDKERSRKLTLRLNSDRRSEPQRQATTGAKDEVLSYELNSPGGLYIDQPLGRRLVGHVSHFFLLRSGFVVDSGSISRP